MNTDQINKLIEQENERSESEVSDNARGFIQQILRSQANIKNEELRIQEYRDALKKLEYTPIQPATVTGL